jgi:hypothetical protein
MPLRAGSVDANGLWRTTRNTPGGLFDGDAGTAGLAATLTHTPPPVTTSAWGLWPTAIVAVTRSVRGSTRDTVPSPLLATHTDPSPKATPRGRLPTPIVVVTERVVGLIRTSVSASVSATQTAPAPTAIPLAPGPTGMTVDTLPVESIRETVPSVASATHVAPSPIAIPLGSLPTSIRETLAPPSAIRTTSAEASLATHATPPPTASAFGLSPADGISATRTVLTTDLNVGSMRAATPRVESTVHNADESAATPSTSPNETVPTTRRDAGSRFEIEWSTVFATHTPPTPAAMLSGPTPTDVSSSTRSETGLMTATEFATAVIVPLRWALMIRTAATATTIRPSPTIAAIRTDDRQRLAPRPAARRPGTPPAPLTAAGSTAVPSWPGARGARSSSRS